MNSSTLKYSRCQEMNSRYLKHKLIVLFLTNFSGQRTKILLMLLQELELLTSKKLNSLKTVPMDKVKAFVSLLWDQKTVCAL